MIDSKYMEFDKVGDTGQTEIWNILSKSSSFILGQVKCMAHGGNTVFFHLLIPFLIQPAC